ncbi:DUF1919 domain-containing protein [Actinobacillus equuli]|uniref:DUF1919 domain-containing protein n=1 Tax=Actinobacillus equuli TaxID=718 RepID=UPI0024425F87|nr:DUF1919 domain-containing protein [Actinobacillus equuli]WGE57042.1 DUF1919 domain-containing protein [Actinobacillus equuli subsp. equuli]
MIIVGGGKVYQELGISYTSPFVGLFIFSPDYLKLVKNFKIYMNYELEFKKSSIYVDNFDNRYPLANLGDIEIHFLHYSSENEAKEKWDRRKNRIVWNNLFFKMNDNDKCTYQLLKEFDDLDIKGKVIFSSKNYSDLTNLVFFKHNQYDESVGIDLKTYRKYFDAVDWINLGGENLAND